MIEAPILVPFRHFQPLQRIKDLGASVEVAGPGIVSLPSSVDLGHGANPGTTAEVQVLCSESHSCVDPVLIIGGKLFTLGQFDCVYPFGDLQLPGLFWASPPELWLLKVFHNNSKLPCCCRPGGSNCCSFNYSCQVLPEPRKSRRHDPNLLRKFKGCANPDGLRASWAHPSGTAVSVWAVPPEKPWYVGL